MYADPQAGNLVDGKDFVNAGWNYEWIIQSERFLKVLIVLLSQERETRQNVIQGPYFSIFRTC